MNKQNRALIQAAIAGILTAGAGASIIPAHAQEVSCYGINSCKGKGVCGSAKTGAACAGSNACGKQGFLKVSSKEDCVAKKHEVEINGKKETVRGYLTEDEALAALGGAKTEEKSTKSKGKKK